MDAIHALKSTLNYSSQPVSEHLLKEILRGAMQDSARGEFQSWQCIVINDRTILCEIKEFHSSAYMLKDAPIAILVCSDLLRKREADTWFRTCLVASEKILMAVQAKGLGAVRLSVYPVEERVTRMRDLIGLPEEIVPVSLIPIGYPAESNRPTRRLNTSRIHFNHW